MDLYAEHLQRSSLIRYNERYNLRFVIMLFDVSMPNSFNDLHNFKEHTWVCELENIKKFIAGPNT